MHQLRFDRFLLGGLGALVLGVWGCTSVPESTLPEAATPETDRKVVLTTFTVLADMAQTIAGSKLQVESITRLGAEIHNYEPTPSDLTKAQAADLLLYNGLNLEVWFESFLGNLEAVPAVLLTEGIEPIPIAEGAYRDRPNPHAWMSPQNGLIYIENIRQAFVALDPENAEVYNENAAQYRQAIEAIDRQLRQALESVPLNQRYLVSCEGAFSYLTRDYGLTEIYMWPINAEQQFTPKQIQTVIEKVKTYDIPSVFCESTVSDKGQREVAKATNANFGGTLYVDSLSLPDGPVPTYLELLQYDVETIAKGLTGEAQ
ncbi:MAG: metal ABC transporter substrate-binding protein [Prochlorotrichaceae cyanobacterium]|jgi:manganese transport system substrate-binding protein